MLSCLENIGIYNLGEIEPQTDLFLLYAPLSCNSVIVSADDLRRLESAATGEDQSEEYIEVLEALAEHNPIARIRGVEDFVNLSILPTNSCNFACTYCYSAKGRSKQTIDFATVERMIRLFVGIKRNGNPPLHITMFGGGEPMLCWKEIVRPAIELIDTLREGYPSNIYITLITNGSIVPNDFVEVCLRANIDLAISFEVLEELQNLQRRNYGLIYNNILRISKKGLVPAINSVITEEAVLLMPNMVREAVEKIPGVKYLSFEPVTGEHTAEYYANFTDNFFEAKNIADKHGIALTTSVLRNVDVTVERYCAGELALNANGEITACPCLSSPDQPGYQRWVYGHASADKIIIDTDKLTSLLSYDVDRQPWCKHCFARYNCGGGCINNAIERGNKPDVNYCNYFKAFLRKTIIERTL